jgi:hypothetical protein
MAEAAAEGVDILEAAEALDPQPIIFLEAAEADPGLSLEVKPV